MDDWVILSKDDKNDWFTFFYDDGVICCIDDWVCIDEVTLS
jgi:hypothetical protein